MAARQNVTLTTVAEAAQVSIATVSRVLNGRGQVDAMTRRRVLEAVEELGYDASTIVRKATAIMQADNQQRTYRIELLLCPLREQKNMLILAFFDEILRGIQSFLQRSGSNTVLNICTWEADPERYHEENERLFGQLLAADGILVIGYPAPGVLEMLQEHGKNPVLIAGNHEGLPVNSIEQDEFGGGRIAAGHLIENGYRKIGFISSSPAVRTFQSRMYGAMLKAAQELGPDAFVGVTSQSSDSDDVAACVRKLLKSPERPEALITCHAEAAYTVFRVMTELGLRCPEDCAVVTFDDPDEKVCNLAFTHLQTFPRQMGIQAARRVVQLMTAPGDSEEQPFKIVLPLVLKTGNSVRTHHHQ